MSMKTIIYVVSEARNLNIIDFFCTCSSGFYDDKSKRLNTLQIFLNHILSCQGWAQSIKQCPVKPQ